MNDAKLLEEILFAERHKRQPTAIIRLILYRSILLHKIINDFFFSL